MPKLPWFPFYSRDFFNDEKVKLMGHAEVGMYLRLLDHQWNEGSVSEKVALSFCSNVGKNAPIERAQMRNVLSQCFTLLGELDTTRMMNPRLERIRAEQLTKEAIQHEIKVKGGQARARQMYQQPASSKLSSELSSSSGNQSQSQSQKEKEREESPLRVPPFQNGERELASVDNSDRPGLSTVQELIRKLAEQKGMGYA